METREYLGYSYEQINQVAKFIKLIVPNFKPLVGVICGSGLGPLADNVSNKVEVPYEDIPLFPMSTVEGHGGKLVFGKVGDVPVVCMKGRFHAYEGYPLWKVVMPVRVMRLLGVEYLIVTNAAGGIPPEMNVGDMMIIRDHVNFLGMGGQNPLRGPNIEEFGPRFPAMNKTYDRGLVKVGLKIAESLGMKDMTHEGVYACVGGPNYETIAELLMMQICGIGSVGMSTAHEVIVAGHCGMKVFAFSLISNKAILDYDSKEEPNHEEVMAAAKAKEAKLQSFTEAMIKYMGTAGVGPLADSLQDKVEVPYEDIPLFPTSTVAGHEGKLVFGKVGDVPVVCMKGRFHAYEGYPLWKVVMPVRVMRLLGAEYLIVTNAAGGIPPEMNVGDMMIIKDHVNFMGLGGQNPLRGPNIDEFGPRFPALNKTYDRGLVKAGLKIAESLGMKDSTHEGVYACIGGPNYETIAEYVLMQICGIQAVGMSTAHEVIAAGHCGMKVFAFSLISDRAILDYDSTEEPNHEAVMAAVKASESKLQKFTEAMIKHMGSVGGGPLADSLQDKVEVPYEDIPLFPTSTVAGHGGKLVFGKVGDVPVVCMQGRFHAYEGYPLWKVVMPVRVMRLLGVENLIVTNAAEGINDSFNVGDMMIIKDHVNMMGMGGQNPLKGPNMEEFGPRFIPMNKVYDRGFVKAGRKIAENLGMADITREGVYACLGGPNYETIAELKMLQICGVDSVGMSTAHEVIAAAHCGMKVFAFSLITNKAILDYDCPDVPNPEEVMTAAKVNEDKLKTFTENMIKYIGGQLSLDCGASGEGAPLPKAEEGMQAVTQTQFIPGICPAAIIPPCPCASSPQLAPPAQAPCAAEEIPGDDAGPAGEAPQEALTKRVSIQEPGEAEEEGGKEAAEAEATDGVGEAGEAPETGEAGEASEAGEAPEASAEVTEEPPQEIEPDKDVAVGPEEPQNQDYQSQTVEDRAEQTESSVEVEPIQEVGLQIEESTTEDGVAIQTLPETAEAKVGVEEPIVEESATEEAPASVEASTETPAEAPTEASPEAPEVTGEEPAAPVEEATEEPKEATEEVAAEIPGEAEEAQPPSDEVEAAGPPSEVTEPAGEAPVKEVVLRSPAVCSAAVKVECKSFAKCILQEANVGPDTPIPLAGPPVEEANVGPDAPIEPEVKKETPIVQQPDKEQEPCIAPCKKFLVRKKGDRCPTTCPSKK